MSTATAGVSLLRPRFYLHGLNAHHRLLTISIEQEKMCCSTKDTKATGEGGGGTRKGEEGRRGKTRVNTQHDTTRSLCAIAAAQGRITTKQLDTIPHASNQPLRQVPTKTPLYTTMYVLPPPTPNSPRESNKDRVSCAGEASNSCRVIILTVFFTTLSAKYHTTAAWKFTAEPPSRWWFGGFPCVSRIFSRK